MTEHFISSIKEKDVIYHCIGDDFNQGVLSCGYMLKPTADYSQYNFNINYYSCFVLLRGRGFYINDAGEKTPIEAGDLVQRLPNVCHSTEVYPDGEWLEFYISFGKGTFDYLKQLNLIVINSPIIKPHTTLDTYRTFSHLLERLKCANSSMLPSLHLEAQAIVLSLHEGLHKKNDDTSNLIINEACRILSSRINQIVDLDKLSHDVNMSYENLRKIFKNKVGISPIQYRIEQKMKQAKLMLLSNVSIKEVAQLTGYSDTYSFTKQFTKTVGIAPGQFVKSY